MNNRTIGRKKNFPQDQKINRWLCSNPRIVPVIMSTKFPTAVIVIGVNSNEEEFWEKEVWTPSSLDCNNP